MSINRAFQFFGGVCGAMGVAAYAASSHGNSAHLATVAPFLLIHAPAFLALSCLSASNKLTALGGYVILVGLALFTGDLIARDFLGDRLFVFAAPTGGSLMIIGWLAVAFSAFTHGKQNPA
ncbi:MAG: DUF423 domain-containing protein [Phyllobacterium sp.]